VTLSRREFLKTGTGLVIAFSLSSNNLFSQTTGAVRLPGSLNNNRMLDSWLRIGADGSVTIFSGKIELGQGIGTALTQIAADELDVDLKRISLVQGDTALTPNEGQTAGSQSMQDSGTAVRFACAEARDILLSAAAAKLDVPASELKVADGTISGPAEKKISYWDLAGEANFKKEATAQAKPKPPSEHKWIGKSVPRRDIPKKFTGGAAYVQDVRLPGMVFGRVVRPPSPDATLKSVDTGPVRRMPGVIAVVRDGSFLGVVAEREEQAVKAREMLKKSAQWNESPTLPPTGALLYDYMVGLGTPGRRCTRRPRTPRLRRRRHFRLGIRAPSRRTARSGRPAPSRNGKKARKAASCTCGRIARASIRCAATSPRCSASSPRRSAAPTPKVRAATATTAPTTWRSTPPCSHARLQAVR
jgi:nicotinate dehydrogenase subunit B